MKKKIIYISLFLPFLTFLGCKHTNTNTDTVTAKTAVTATTINHQNVQQIVWLNATATLLKNSPIKSTVTGYITHTSLTPGQSVRAGQVLFVLKTQEAQAIGEMLPDSLQLSGKIVIRATTSGYISQLNHLQGDYVQKGDPLCTIADQSSFVFILHLPYQYNQDIKLNTQVPIKLPDGRQIKGTVASRMPVLDAQSQTLRYQIKVNPSLKLPENLIAQVGIVTQSKKEVQMIPKSAVLSDVSLSHFWVMKLINDTTAVKIAIKIGIENNDSIEIINPQFQPETRILISGNYGLPDTTLVQLQNKKVLK